VNTVTTDLPNLSRALLVTCLVAGGCTPRRGDGPQRTKPEPAPELGAGRADTASAGPSTPSSDGPAAEPTACLRRIEIDHHDSILEEQRGLGPHRSDFQRAFESADIDPETMTPVAAVQAIEVAGEPVFWWTAKKDAAMVDADIAGSLKSKDAFVLRPGERFELGTLEVDAAGRLDGIQWLELLSRAHVIGTYAHLEATLCVERQVGAPGTDDGYRAFVRAQHVYYTNERNEDAYAFTFGVDPERRLYIEAE